MAYYLRQFANSNDVDVNITVFERNPYVGGRSTTVNAWDDPTYPIELGATLFVEENKILVNATRAFNLSTTESTLSPVDTKNNVGVWDGHRFVNLIPNEPSWKTFLRVTLKYPGWSLPRTIKLTKSVVNNILQLYEKPNFPWTSLSKTVDAIGLARAVDRSGAQLLQSTGVSDNFARELIQGVTRVNYAQNLNVLHGVDSVVALVPQDAYTVAGGNWQIFAHMLSAAGAHVHINSTVTNIHRTTNSTGASVIVDGGAGGDFDHIVIAAPLDISSLQVTPALPAESKPPSVEYVQLRVTLFASPRRLPGTFFRMSDDDVPLDVLTTLPEDIKPGKDSAFVGPTGFFSISLRGQVKPPGLDTQYVYKIFSPGPGPFNITLLAEVLGIPSEELPASGKIADLPKTYVSWSYEKTWHSYPVARPTLKFGDVKLADGLWYTSGMDNFVSTMETNALSGKNVAALIVEELSR